MKHLKPREAHAFLHDNPDAVLIDCRSEMEYLFVGHPKGAHHVAWNDGPDWDINPHFVGQVKKVASMNRPVEVKSGRVWRRRLSSRRHEKREGIPSADVLPGGMKPVWNAGAGRRSFRIARSGKGVRPAAQLARTISGD